MPSQHSSKLKVKSYSFSRASNHSNDGINFRERHRVFKGGIRPSEGGISLPKTVYTSGSDLQVLVNRVIVYSRRFLTYWVGRKKRFGPKAYIHGNNKVQKA